MNDVTPIYPPNPTPIPTGLTTPSSSYRLRVFIVLGSLVLFLVLYLGLVVGTAYLSYWSFSQVFGTSSPPSSKGPSSYRPRSRDDNPIWWIVLGIGSGVLCVFLVRGFFKRQRTDPALRVEITEKEQPVLFAFIRQLCRDTKAPFPHRVYLSHEVNASVFYHSSIFSLFLPTHKNLLIGLGLVNQLNLSEFKAVLAHEFGHFSQRSMKLGTYVYTSNRIIADIVYGRDWLDDLIGTLRNIDIRIAIFAWAFTAVLWCLRKMLEGLFRVINFANSALSRQMEFNADLVAVSVTGSDALIYSLARLDFANDSLMQAWNDLTAAGDHQLFSRDLFYHQTKAAEYLRAVRKDPKLGEPPPLPEDPQERVQVFEPGDSGVPLMWATHPSNHDREQNAKRRYIRCPLDQRPAWVLFTNSGEVRERVTRHIYEVVKKVEDVPFAEPEKVQAFIDDEHAETTYHPRYQGMYDDRYVLPGDLAALVKTAPSEYRDAQRLTEVHTQLYGEELKSSVEKYVGHMQEHYLLSGLTHGSLELKGKDFPFREGRYRASDVPRLLERVEKDLDADREWLADIDRQVFQVHYAMARHLGGERSTDLEERYRFHLAVQVILSELSGCQTEIQIVLSQLGGERQISQDTFQSALAIFRRSHAALRKRLESADEMRIPQLKNMTDGLLLGRFLLDKSLVQGLHADTLTLDGEWIRDFLNQLGEVVDKIRRIHFKSLGGILALQEKIADEWSAMSAIPEVIPHPGEK